MQNAWRRDAYTTGNGRCINTNSLTSVACTGPGGAAGFGDVIQERQGGTRFDPGDGSGLIGSPVVIGGSNALLYLVTSHDAANNWLFADALDPASLPGLPTDTLITHTYASAATFTAKIEDCCRISPCVAPTAHINNPDNGYEVLTEVDVGTTPANSSPVSALPPIIFCPINGLCQFTVPVSDNELNAVTFRMSTDSEANFNDLGESGQPGQGQPGTAAGCATNASIDSLGVYSWNTVGCTLAGDPLGPPPDGGCNQPSFNTCYSTQVTIEETVALSQVALDFLICLVPCPPGNSAPEFVQPGPQCGSVISANPGQPVSFSIQADDADTAEDVTLNAVGVPGGATLTPPLPATGNPVSTTFAWTPTPGDLGQHVVTFTATDTCGAMDLCSITIDVSQEDCTNGIDNDDDDLVDCADPDCAGTTCIDGNLCTIDDICQGGICVGTPIVCQPSNPPCEGGSVCNPGTGNCVPQADAPPSTPCDADGNLCTIDHCDGAGLCVFQSTVTCQAANPPCEGGETCNPNTGNCVAQPDPPASTACDTDGNLCTIDHCDGTGSCVFQNNVACQAPNPPCEGGEVCNPGTGSCVPQPDAPLSTPCDADGSSCTTDHCDGNGQCVLLQSACDLDAFLCYQTKGNANFAITLADQPSLPMIVRQWGGHSLL